jgi:ribosome-binding factor A
MPSHSFTRSDRLSAELRRLVGTLVHDAVREHALPSMSVSDVECTKDFDVATVYVTALLPDTAPEGMKALKAMARDMRMQLSKIMRVRRVPELRFKYDDSVDRGERIDALLRGEK